MRIFAVNGSPRKDKGNTHRILGPFLEGAEEAGAEVDLVFLQGMDIRPCRGCFNCWLKTPGRCVQKDDMAGLLEMMGKADVQVLATPLYVFGMSAQLKTMMDRIIPMAKPFIELMDGHCAHPAREGFKHSDMVLISNCGFHEMDNFDALVMHVKELCRISGANYLGALLRPHGEILQALEALAPGKAEPIYEAAREAGRLVANNGAISQKLSDQVALELMPREEYVSTANQYFQAEIEKQNKAAS